MSTDYFVSRARSPLGELPGGASPFSPSTPTSSSTPRTTALSSKVTIVLANSYADLELRDALGLLDARNVENTPETRRQLRLDVQKEVIDSNANIIREFGRVADQLKRIGNTIQTLNQGCEEMRRHISASRQETRPVLEEASELLAQRDNVETKQQLLTAFNAHFIISEDDNAVLTSSAEPVDDRFFAILSRAKKIQKDCEVLLGTENQRLGQEIMDQVSKNINSAFQKLFRWIQREFKALNLENPQISTSIRRALRVLAERPSLFQSCLDFFSEARQRVLSDAFYTALTGSSLSGEANKSVKPIELVAHDPLRYVGDMLAWAHSAAASEREALEAMFISDGDEIARGIQAGRENEPWNDYFESQSSFDGVKALNDLIDRNMSAVARVLRQRIEQVVQSYDETIMAYKIANLINFYLTMFSRVLGEHSALRDLLVDLEAAAMRQFHILLRDGRSTWQGEEQQISPDLSIPDFLDDGLKQLVDIMKTYGTSFASAAQLEADFQPLLKEAFDPCLSACQGLAESLHPPNKQIFEANCLLAAQAALQPFQFTSQRLQGIQEDIDAHAEQLVKTQYRFFKQASGLEAMINALSEPAHDASTTAALDVFQPQALTIASQHLDDFLPSGLMDALEHLARLNNTGLARRITEDAATEFCEDFETIEAALDAIDDAENGTKLRSMFPRTSAELRVLLS